MKNKLYLFVTLILVSTTIKAQYVTVTDTNFVNWLKAHGYIQCFNGMQLDTTCDAVLKTTYLKCGPVIGMGAFQNMDGIQYFKNLDTLECTNDSLTTLASLPPKLIYLDCRDNFLLSVPNLPLILLILICQTNQLASLPSLPPNLQILSCGENAISSLPPLPSSLTLLGCGYNNITNLPELPDSLSSLICAFNPNLSCLPYLNRIVTLDFEGTNIECLPDYGNVTNSTPPLNTLPLCDSINPNNCPLYTGITNITMDNFAVQPNPCTNKIICTVAQLQPNTYLQIFGLDGRLIHSIQVINENTEVNISILSSGLYFLVMQNENGMVVKKLVKE